MARVSGLLRKSSDILTLTMYSVQTVTGGQCMSVLLTAIWPSFARIPNHIPEDQGITTSGMVGFLLYFLLQLPFLCIPYTKVATPSACTGTWLTHLFRSNTSLPSRV